MMTSFDFGLFDRFLFKCVCLQNSFLEKEEDEKITVFCVNLKSQNTKPPSRLNDIWNNQNFRHFRHGAALLQLCHASELKTFQTYSIFLTLDIFLLII